MDPLLAAALAPVLRDLAATGVPTPRIEDDDWAGQPDQLCAMLHSPDGTAMGVWASRSDSAVDRVVAVADQVQEWAIDELRDHAPTNWPPCPRHPDTHPLRADLHDGAAWWSCPTDLVPVAAIGAL